MYGEELQDAKAAIETKRNHFLKVAVALVVIAIAIGTCAMVANLVSRDYRFIYAVHSHTENAYFASDPVTMKTELILVRQGMESLQLTPDLYGAWLPWDKTPDKRMDWQYAHLDSIILRVDEFMSWERQQNVSGTSQQLQDVYSQKLNNVRAFIKEDTWSDWIAEDAFAFRDYFVTSVILPILGELLFFMGFGCFFLGGWYQLKFMEMW